MELASMLAGESFTDRPATVCPVIASFLRAYNDLVPTWYRDDLRAYASEAVGTCRPDVRRARVRRIVEVVVEYDRRSAWWRRGLHRWNLKRLQQVAARPLTSATLDGIGLLAASRLAGSASGREHANALVTELIAIRVPVTASTAPAETGYVTWRLASEDSAAVGV